MGGDKVSAREIIRDSGINVGKNILSADMNEVKNKIEKHPWIKKAEVRRLYPSELEISVLERVPVALIKFDDIYYIDGDGVVFERVASEDEVNLPIITGVEMKEILKDDSSGSDGIFKALSFIEVFEKKGFNHVGEITEIKVNKLNGLTLYAMNGAVKIDMGNGDYENRLYRLESIVANLKSGLKGVDFVDLDYEKKGVIRYKNSSGFSKI
jgi:cell division protein FtsQ